MGRTSTTKRGFKHVEAFANFARPSCWQRVEKGGVLGQSGCALRERCINFYFRDLTLSPNIKIHTTLT